MTITGQLFGKGRFLVEQKLDTGHVSAAVWKSERVFDSNIQEPEES